jgi:Bacterial Ig-like domain (group 3)
MDGGTSLGVLTLTPSGAAAITTSTLAAGTHTFTITYNGDGNYY